LARCISHCRDERGAERGIWDAAVHSTRRM
jgi:hypothetical protein